MIKNLPADAGDLREAGSIPGSEGFPGGGNGNPLQYSCLENPKDRGAWRATVHRVTKSQTGLKRLSTPESTWRVFPGSAKNLPANAEDMDLIPGLGRSLRGGNGNLLQYSYLENSMDRGAWQATVNGVTKLDMI